MRSKILILAGVMIIPLAAHASRVKDHSLTECIQKAHIIISGSPEYNSLEDQGDVGVFKVRVIWKYKGTLDEKQIRIADKSFHSKYTPRKPGPIVVKPGRPYIFFLKAEVNEQGQYLMFDPCDGVILPSGPVYVEIMNQVRKQNANTQKTASTPRDRAVAQATAYLLKQSWSPDYLQVPSRIIEQEGSWDIRFKHTNWKTREPSECLIRVEKKSGKAERVPLR